LIDRRSFFWGYLKNFRPKNENVWFFCAHL